MLRASVPRNLRVRSSIQLSNARVPARAFLIAAGLIFAGGLMVVAGADLLKTVKFTGVLIVAGLVIFELRWWGRSTGEVARILWRHYRRSRRLRLDPLMISVPTETSPALAARRPRWQQ